MNETYQMNNPTFYFIRPNPKNGNEKNLVGITMTTPVVFNGDAMEKDFPKRKEANVEAVEDYAAIVEAQPLAITILSHFRYLGAEELAKTVVPIANANALDEAYQKTKQKAQPVPALT